MRTTVAILTLLVSVWAVSLSAQPAVGTLKGQVTDPSAAAVTNATVMVRGANGFVRQARSDVQGLYTVSGLPPGQYDVRVEVKGFAPFEALGVNIPAGVVSLNAPLTVAMETQSVTVNTALFVPKLTSTMLTSEMEISGASSSRIVGNTWVVASVALVGLDKLTIKSSFPSNKVSPITVKVMDWFVVPGAKTAVPLVA